jgi:hypothetical protein
MEEIFVDRGVRVRILSRPAVRTGSFNWAYEVEPMTAAARDAFGGDYARRHGIHSESVIPRAETCLSEADALEHARAAAKQAIDLAFDGEQPLRAA